MKIEVTEDNTMHMTQNGKCKLNDTVGKVIDEKNIWGKTSTSSKFYSLGEAHEQLLINKEIHSEKNHF